MLPWIMLCNILLERLVSLKDTELRFYCAQASSRGPGMLLFHTITQRPWAKMYILRPTQTYGTPQSIPATLKTKAEMYVR